MVATCWQAYTNRPEFVMLYTVLVSHIIFFKQMLGEWNRKGKQQLFLRAAVYHVVARLNILRVDMILSSHTVWFHIVHFSCSPVQLWEHIDHPSDTPAPVCKRKLNWYLCYQWHGLCKHLCLHGVGCISQAIFLKLVRLPQRWDTRLYGWGSWCIAVFVEGKC